MSPGAHRKAQKKLEKGLKLVAQAHAVLQKHAPAKRKYKKTAKSLGEPEVAAAPAPEAPSAENPSGNL